MPLSVNLPVRSVRPSERRLRGLALLFAASLLTLLPAWSARAAPPTLAVLDFDLLDDQRDTVPDHTLGPRMAAIRTQLADALASNGLYVVVDNAPARERIDAARSTEDLHRCNGCELALGRALGADRVLVGWVQKVSNLILNINVRIEVVATGEVVLVKSVDLRGNTDETWRRGIAYLVRDLVEQDRRAR